MDGLSFVGSDSDDGATDSNRVGVVIVEDEVEAIRGKNGQTEEEPNVAGEEVMDEHGVRGKVRLGRRGDGLRGGDFDLVLEVFSKHPLCVTARVELGIDLSIRGSAAHLYGKEAAACLRHFVQIFERLGIHVVSGEDARAAARLRESPGRRASVRDVVKRDFARGGRGGHQEGS